MHRGGRARVHGPQAHNSLFHRSDLGKGCALLKTLLKGQENLTWFKKEEAAHSFVSACSRPPAVLILGTQHNPLGHGQPRGCTRAIPTAQVETLRHTPVRHTAKSQSCMQHTPPYTQTRLSNGVHAPVTVSPKYSGKDLSTRRVDKLVFPPRSSQKRETLGKGVVTAGWLSSISDSSPRWALSTGTKRG